MSLTAADVAEIMRLVEQSNFDELTLEMDGIKLCLRRAAGGAADAGAADGATAGSPTPGAAHTAAATAGPLPPPPPPPLRIAAARHRHAAPSLVAAGT